ncbi:hypothetical protein PR048_006387 [Dryococelus australis]|uniref:Uncharacterized protein n=1 Tax=Dryococelus australis TaxID=614101 RepID=A0ABQ9IAW2_9NEOP|nr:hypothetical protein PR048_006387 [Dryococelus australis]
MLGWFPNKGHGRFLPNPSPIPLPCEICTISNDLAVDEALTPTTYLRAVHAALREHCTSVQSPAHSGDGALIARASVALIAPVLLSQKGDENYACRRDQRRKKHRYILSGQSACLPPWRTGFNPGRVTPDFRMWESCRTMSLVRGFSLGSPVFPALSFRRCSILTSITIIGSQDPDDKSLPNLFTSLHQYLHSGAAVANRVRFPSWSFPELERFWESCRTTGRRVFSGVSRFPLPYIPALFHYRLISPLSALKTWLLRVARISGLDSSRCYNRGSNKEGRRPTTHVLFPKTSCGRRGGDKASLQPKATGPRVAALTQGRRLAVETSAARTHASAPTPPATLRRVAGISCWLALAVTITYDFSEALRLEMRAKQGGCGAGPECKSGAEESRDPRDRSTDQSGVIRHDLHVRPLRMRNTSVKYQDKQAVECFVVITDSRVTRTVLNRLRSNHECRTPRPGSIPGRVTPDFRMWESCRTMPMVGGFSRVSPVSPVLIFRRCSILTSITLIGSQDLDVKSRPNLFSHECRTSVQVFRASLDMKSQIFYDRFLQFLLCFSEGRRLVGNDPLNPAPAILAQAWLTEMRFYSTTSSEIPASRVAFGSFCVGLALIKKETSLRGRTSQLTGGESVGFSGYNNYTNYNFYNAANSAVVRNTEIGYRAAGMCTLAHVHCCGTKSPTATGRSFNKRAVVLRLIGGARTCAISCSSGKFGLVSVNTKVTGDVCVGCEAGWLEDGQHSRVDRGPSINRRAVGGGRTYTGRATARGRPVLARGCGDHLTWRSSAADPRVNELLPANTRHRLITGPSYPAPPFPTPITFTLSRELRIQPSHAYTQSDVNTTRQLRALRLAAMVHVIRMGVSPLSLRLFSAPNTKKVSGRRVP